MCSGFETGKHLLCRAIPLKMWDLLTHKLTFLIILDFPTDNWCVVCRQTKLNLFNCHAHIAFCRFHAHQLKHVTLWCFSYQNDVVSVKLYVYLGDQASVNKSQSREFNISDDSIKRCRKFHLFFIVFVRWINYKNNIQRMTCHIVDKSD
jgi:hypothetical protein